MAPTDPGNVDTDSTIDALTNLELMEVEELVGPKFGTPEAPKIRLIVAMAHVIRKRDLPGVSYDDTVAIPFVELAAIVEAAADPEA